MTKERKFFVLILLLISIFFISGCVQQSLKNTSQQNINKEDGLYDIVQIGNLSFQLAGVNLITMDEPKLEKNVKSSSLSRVYAFSLALEVINEGEEIANVSDCGILLFEDGSQQKQDPYEWGTLCESSIMVPDAKQIIYSTFYSDHYSYSLSKWSQPKITYFLQQEQGLIRYTIYQKDIIHINESS